MQILVISYGESWEALASSSLIRRLHRQHDDMKLSWVTKPVSRCIFQYNNRIDELYDGETKLYQKFDLAINLTPTDEAGDILKSVDAEQKLGFLSSTEAVSQGAESVIDILAGRKISKKHYFQLLYRVAELAWRGDGYDLSYYPRNKMKKKKTGVAVTDPRLRTFVKNNLVLNYSAPWHVPMRHDLLKRVDEINRVKHIITDDLFCAHAGIAMRKHVEFLDTNEFNMSIEFFGKGHHHVIKNDSWRI